MATPLTPGCSQWSDSASKVRTTSPEPTTNPERRRSTHDVESASISSKTVLASPQGVATGTALKSFPESEYCGNLRESPPEWIIRTRCPDHHCSKVAAAGAALARSGSHARVR